MEELQLPKLYSIDEASGRPLDATDRQIGIRSQKLRNHVKLDAVHERVVVDWSSVSGALTQRFAILLARSMHVRPGHAGEGNHLDRVISMRTDPVAY